MSELETFLSTGVFAFMLVFTRIGTAMIIMPGIGDSMTPQNVRLYIALGLALVLAPLVQPFVPDPLPGLPVIFTLLIMEFIIGLFIGSIARVFMIALDTAGMVISLTSGFANAQVFNPSLAAQGSIAGAFLSMLGVTLLFVTNLHHLLIYGLVESYHLFPVGGVPDTGSMAELMAKAVSTSFAVGFQIAIPFVLVGMMIYIGMGVLARLMPQVQVFILALPVQILLSLIILGMALPAMMLYWMSEFESGMMYFLSNGGE